MNTKRMLTFSAAVGLVLASAASAQIPSALWACPSGTKYAEAPVARKGARLASTEGAGNANPRLASTEGAGNANPRLASAEAGNSSGMATRLSNGVARMPDGTYCSPVQ